MIEYIEIGCIAIAAFVMAFGEALKREPAVWKIIPFSAFFKNRNWRFAPSILVTIAVLIWIGDRLSESLHQHASDHPNQIAAPPDQETSSRSTSAQSQGSPFLGLDDVKRWQWAYSLFRATVGNNNRRVTSCHARVWGSPPETSGFKSATAFWNEIMQVIYLGDWSLEGGQRPRNYYPDGITILTASDHGETFDCGFHLAEWFRSIGVKTVTLEANQTTPDLIDCKNECIELVLGNITLR